ncbi:hypothetical protein T03_9866, partial [Trichinella britovi]
LATGIFGCEHAYTGDHNTSDSYKSYYIMAQISSSFHQLRCTGKPLHSSSSSSSSSCTEASRPVTA